MSAWNPMRQEFDVDDEVPPTTLSREQLVDAIESLRRTAIAVRAEGSPGWIAGALNLEAICREREAQLRAMDAK